MTDTTRTRLVLCPYCGHKLDALSKLGGKSKPRPGDVSLCIECAHILLLTDQLTPRKPAAGELDAAYAAQPELRASLQAKQRHIILAGFRFKQGTKQ